MKFSIELDEFWLDEDSDYLDKELKKSITNQIVSVIYGKIKDKVEDQIARQVKETVESIMYKKAALYMDECFQKGVIPTDVYENGRTVKKDLTLEEYVINKFKKDSGWSSPNDKIEKMSKQFAEKFGQEIKDRYDLLFATQIVKKLDKEGLLKENIAKMILESNS